MNADEASSLKNLASGVARSSTSLDPGVFNEYLEEMGEEGKRVIYSLIEIFCKTSPEKIAAMQQAFDTQNRQQLNRTSHNMKSSAAAVGAVQLVVMCGELEQKTASEQPGASQLPAAIQLTLAGLIERIQQEYAVVREALIKIQREYQP